MEQYTVNITAVTLGGDGNYYYTGTQQEFDQSTSNYIDSPNPITFDTLGTGPAYLVELNNAELGAFPLLVTAYRRGQTEDGTPIYEFIPNTGTAANWGYAAFDVPGVISAETETIQVLGQGMKQVNAYSVIHSVQDPLDTLFADVLVENNWNAYNVVVDDTLDGYTTGYRMVNNGVDETAVYFTGGWYPG
jgi:hypothetical protein